MVNAERHNELYRQGCDLIGPAMLLDSEEGAGELVERVVNETEVKEGIQILEEVVEINPGNWAAHWTMGKGYQALEDHQLSYEKFVAAYKVGRNAAILRELVRECLYVDKIDEAIYYGHLATELEPDDAGLQANFALSLLLNKEVDRALATAEASLRKDPDDKITQQMVGFMKKIKEGKQELPKSLAELEKL
jgi:tetratricopeptide (TPR) repeat protein